MTTLTARRVGAERHPVAVVEGFHPDPDALRAAALAAAFGSARQHYPGVRAELPAGYFAAVRAPLVAVLGEVLGGGGGADLLDASFSVVTTPPERLSLAQRLPHVDAIQPGRVALVHYLVPGTVDGTAFFRHRSTGYESIDAARRGPYFATLERELAALPEPPSGYNRDGDALFERIGHVEGAFNRAVIYRSAQLHSGAISPGAVLSADPALGRLTVTAFLQLR